MSHLYPLSKIPPQTITEGGSRSEVTKANFPLLKGMSFYKLILKPKAIREPHWHANADELGYCLKGTLLVTLFATGNVRSNILVKEGETFFISSGSLHSLANVGETDAEVILDFSHEQPEDFSLSSTLGVFTDSVLGNTWHVPMGEFKEFKRSLTPTFISMGTENIAVPDQARYPTPYRYNLLKAFPKISTEGGTVRVARKETWPILTKHALYALSLTGKGMREPHWHPETAEMGYVAKGKGRMSILSPDGKTETYEMNAGDIYFIPKAYPHHIENLLEGALDIFIFFDQTEPRDIGFTAGIKSFSSQVLETTLHAPHGFFNSLPTYFSDLLIVDKINPVDK